MSFQFGEIYEVRVIGTTHGQNTFNVRHYVVLSASGTDDLTYQGAAGGIVLPLAPLYKDVCTSQWSLQGAGIRRVRPTPTAEVLTAVSPGPGDLVSDPLPDQCAALISLRSQTAPSRTRGRLYLPSQPVDYWDPATQEFSLGHQNAIDQLGLELLKDVTVTAPDLSDVVFSPVLWRRGTDLAFPLTAHITRSRVATVRRRAAIAGTDQLVFA